jgi:hypothetical protein
VRIARPAPIVERAIRRWDHMTCWSTTRNHP